MKNILTPALVLLTFAFNAASAGASETVSVHASRDLHVAIFDSSRLTPARTALYEAFSTSLSAGMTKQCGAPVGVRAVSLEAPRGAMQLASGASDMAIVIGTEVPEAFQSPDFSVTRVVSDIGVPACVFQLVVRKDDPALKKVLSAAFDDALASPHFQDVLGRAIAIKVVASNTR